MPADSRAPSLASNEAHWQDSHHHPQNVKTTSFSSGVSGPAAMTQSASTSPGNIHSGAKNLLGPKARRHQMLCEARQRVSWGERVLNTTQYLWEPGILLTTGPSTGGRTGRAGRNRRNCAVVWEGLRGARPTRYESTGIRQTAAAADW